MAILEDLTEEECALYAILSDASGLDQAEFLWVDEENDDGVFRCWSFQWAWWRDTTQRQIDQCSRSVGKSKSIQARAFAFPFVYPGAEMVVTAPESNHLVAVTDNIETNLLRCRLGREMLVRGRGGIKHKPFHINFANGARIMGRIPQKDGKGVKGIHPLWLELDEGQDYPDKGWIEIIETLKAGSEGAMWRAHGVTRGIRDYFFKLTQPDSGWKVHNYCLPAGTQIYTTNGPISIEEMEVGDQVYCVDENNPNGLKVDVVTDTIQNGVKEIWSVKAHGGYSLESTGNHPYLVLSRGGTRRTRDALAFEWVEAKDLVSGDYVVTVNSLPEGDGLDLSPSDLLSMVSDKSILREVPAYVWQGTKAEKLNFLNGYLMGDGSIGRQKRGQDCIQVGTGSEAMAKQLRALAHYCGIRATNISVAETAGFTGNPQYRFGMYVEDSWFNKIPLSYSSVKDGQELKGLDENFSVRRVLSSESTGRFEETFDITVGDSHTYIAEGMVVHNTAMHRPNWSDAERQAKIKEYGSRDHPDYRRNVLGAHGDATSSLFVLHRLMQCVDTEEASEYNQNTYYLRKIGPEMIDDYGGEILPLMDVPASHRQFKRTWIGMDVGYTNDPSEILVFAEETAKNGQDSKLRLITRYQLSRVSNPHQVDAIEWFINFYKPVAFAMDKTGVGLPLYQEIQNRVKNNSVLRNRLDTIKGYNFSEKILIDFDEAIDFDPDMHDSIEKAGIKRNVLEYSSDKLRELVDSGRIILPYDMEVISEFQGETFTISKASTDMYGRKRFSGSSLHALDAARMAGLGWAQHPIEEMTAKQYQYPDVIGLSF